MVPGVHRCAGWVCPDLLACVRHAEALPARSALLDAPRAILQVVCWGSDAAPDEDIPHWPPPYREPSKLRMQHCLPTAVLPYTAAAQPGAPPSFEALLTEGMRTMGSSRPTRSSSAGRRPDSIRMPPGKAIRTFGGGGAAHSQRLQARTVGLHEDILLAEARLGRLREMRLDSIDPARSAPWVQRALARMPTPRRGVV